MSRMVLKKGLKTIIVMSATEAVVSKTYLDKLTESEIKEKTTTISTRSCTHLRDFEIRHLANDLPRINQRLRTGLHKETKAYLVHCEIDRTTSSIANHEVLRSLKTMKVGELGTVYCSSFRFRNNPQTISPGVIARSGTLDKTRSDSSFSHDIATFGIPCSRHGQPNVGAVFGGG